MSLDGSYLVERGGFIQQVRSVANSNRAYGCHITSLFKPFTTNPTQSGVANYLLPLNMMLSGGLANSSGLNPFGTWTRGEGIVSGPSGNTDLDNNIYVSDVRTMGLKTPTHYVGWGYDIYGYPSPNQNRNWDFYGGAAYLGRSTLPTGLTSSGSLLPSGNFASSGTSFVGRGSLVPPYLWNAGPIDLRWDMNRGVWTAPISTYSCRIIRGIRGGSTASTGVPYYASEFTYDVKVSDGIANSFTVTGIRVINDRPTLYRVYPLSSGSYHLLMHMEMSGRPGYGLLAVETPATFDCSTSNSSLLTAGDVLTGDEMYYSDMPLASRYGGCGYTGYYQNDILIAGSGGDLEKRTLIQGTGISINKTATQIYIGLGTGISYTNNGVNTSITELQGLTTPLSLAQGGTGSSGKNFVDLTTVQSIGGNKSFTSGISVVSGAYNSPSISFLSFYRTGFTASSGNTINLINSGINLFKTNPTGNYCSAPLTIAPYFNANVTGSTILNIVEPTNIYGIDGKLIRFQSADGVELGYAGNKGTFYYSMMEITGQPYNISGVTNLLNINIPSGFNSNTINVNHRTLGSTFSVGTSGNIYVGPTGARTQIIGSTGNKDINLPATGGTFALKEDINYFNAFRSSSGSFSASTSDSFIECTGTPYNMTLFSASNVRGRTLTIRNNGAGSLGVYPTGTETINSTTGYSLGTLSTLWVVSNGNGWVTF